MKSNQEFRKKVQGTKAKFYLCDFHVHSPASTDLRNGKRFDELNDEEKDLIKLIPEDLKNKPVEYEDKVLEVFKVDNYYNMLLRRRNAIVQAEGIPEGEDWAFVAITDHNVCKYSYQLSKYAWDNRKTNRLIILPGMEIDVSFQCSDQLTVKIHVLSIFAPNTSDSSIRTVIVNSCGHNWDFGSEVTVSSLTDFISKLRNNTDYPSICIAAHVASSKGLQKEAKERISVTMNNLQVAIARTEGELHLADDKNKDDVKARLEALKSEFKEEGEITLEVLKLIGECGFDALQVSGKQDEVHYRRLHRYEKQYGRSVPVISSDSHAVDNIFKCGEMIPYLKMSNISSALTDIEIFSTIKDRALRYGETRFSYSHPGKVAKWIAGIEIVQDAANAKDFWPFDATDKNFVIPFSRNLNCLIGGRGSGKSAVIDAISFLTTPQRFDESKKQSQDTECYKRAIATLGGCHLRICWQILGDAKYNLPKGSLYISRYFNTDGKQPQIIYTDGNNSELASCDIPPVKVQLFTVHEIEQTAESSRLRKLFDEMCGNEIFNIQEDISKIISELKNQQVNIISSAKAINQLLGDGSALREYVKRKYNYDAVNKPEVKEQYKKIDDASQAEKLSNKVKEAWEQINNRFELAKRNLEIESFFERLNKAVVDNDQKVKLMLEPLYKLVEIDKTTGKSVSCLQENISMAIEQLQSALDNITSAIDNAEKAIEEDHKNAREILSKEGLPTGGKDREAKKEAYDEAQESLHKYKDLMSEIDLYMVERAKLFDKLLQKCRRRTEIRKETAANITRQLELDLDNSVLKIEADAQPFADKSTFQNWLTKHLAKSLTRNRDDRTKALIANGLTPEKLKRILLGEESYESLEIKKEKVSDGKISKEDALSVFQACAGRLKIEQEIAKTEDNSDFYDSLPDEIKNGLLHFPQDEREELNLKSVLELDEIIYEDIPVIKLNDRPSEPASVSRPLDELSPGQRCSAILPILLLNGDTPLIIDQPEDNLDNRLIRQVIVNILSSIKLRRQVIVATHNPNIPVLGDSEQVVVLRAVEENQCNLDELGNLDESKVVKYVTDIMEGGREAFQYRQTIYQSHWDGAIQKEL